MYDMIAAIIAVNKQRAIDGKSQQTEERFYQEFAAPLPLQNIGLWQKIRSAIPRLGRNSGSSGTCTTASTKRTCSENGRERQNSGDAADADHEKTKAHRLGGLLGLSYGDGLSAAGFLHGDPHCHSSRKLPVSGASIPSRKHRIWLALWQDHPVTLTTAESSTPTMPPRKHVLKPRPTGSYSRPANR